MGSSNYGPKNMWPTLEEWNYLYRKHFRPGLGRSSQPQAIAGVDQLTVIGLLNIDDQLVLLDVARRTLPSNPPTSEPGDLALELLNAAGDILSSTSFGVEFRLSGLALVRTATFEVSTPFVAGTSQLRIRKGASVLASRAVSANPPTLQVLTPAAGQLVDGPIMITWTAADLDGDPLTYTVLYMENGLSPVPLALDLVTASFQWDPSGYGGGDNARILVFANDGVNESQGESATFGVSKASPAVELLSPQNGLAVPAGTSLTLVGAGYDPEDGLLPPSSLSFSSNLDGNLGSGEIITFTLSQGAHTITLHGVDQDGNGANTSLMLTVGPAGQVPFLETATPLMGSPGSVVTLTGQNFGLAGAHVYFGEAEAPTLSSSDTQFIVQVPGSLLPGKLPVYVKHTYSSASLNFQVTYGKPHLDSLEPNSGPPGTLVVLRGSEWDTAIANNQVLFGSQPAYILAAEASNLLQRWQPGHDVRRRRQADHRRRRHKRCQRPRHPGRRQDCRGRLF